MSSKGKTLPTIDALLADRATARGAAARRAVREAEARARRSGGRLIVFGSLAEGGFDERSDVDIALFGLPEGADLEAAAEIDTMLSLAGFSVDVFVERFMSPSLRERVLRHGRQAGALG
jgi:predicted nucleotidyltransferase